MERLGVESSASHASLVRPISFASAALALGLGGVAFAQPRLVVDPWPRSANGASAASGEPAPARSAPGGPIEIRDPWAAPSGASNAPPDAPVISRIASGLDEEGKAAAKPAATRRGHAAAWSARFNEIVDPWHHVPQVAASYGAKLIVDPWAASVRRAQHEPRE